MKESKSNSCKEIRGNEEEIVYEYTARGTVRGMSSGELSARRMG